jgi:hypothetical protein
MTSIVTPRSTTPRLVGLCVLPDGREAMETGRTMRELWDAGADLVDPGQFHPMACVAVSNQGNPGAA